MEAAIIIGALDELNDEDLKIFKFYLKHLPQTKCPCIPESKLQDKTRSEVTDVMIELLLPQKALDVTVNILELMKKKQLVRKMNEKIQKNQHDFPKQPSKKRRLSHGHSEYFYQSSSSEETLTDSRLTRVQELQSVVKDHKSSLRKNNEFLMEKTTEKKNIPLNRIFTNLTITNGESNKIHNEHEVLETNNSHSDYVNRINCNEIFGASEEQIRTVLTKGVAGIGKSVSVQKFILDWAENKANQDIIFLFVLPFRKLNLIKDRCWSLHELLIHLHPSLIGCCPSLYSNEKILFIFDGLEESRIPLSFKDVSMVNMVDKESTVATLIISLISRELLPSALIWITSRPAAASVIPSKYVDRVIEIQGFSDQQKEEYFKKRVDEKNQADKIISHIKASRILQNMCRIPVFCWISLTVLQPWLRQESKAEIPTTLTEMYSHFLLVQTNTKNQKFDEGFDGNDSRKLFESNREIILKLAELAFKQLLKGNVMFLHDDLRESGINTTEASVYTGIFTEGYKMESVFYQTKVYYFVHLSFQEFFAALHVFYCFLCKKMTELKVLLPKTNAKLSGEIPLETFMKCVVNEALESKTGHLDLFLRFLHGILLESNQRLLQGLLTQIYSDPESIKKIIQNLKRCSKKHINPERLINLSQCLIEMKDNSLLQEIQNYFKSKNKSKKLSPAHCSTMAILFQASEEVMDMLDLKKYNTSEEGRKRLLPALRNSRKANLADCNLTIQSCENIASALQSANSPLRELDLSNNDLEGSRIKLLSNGLKNSYCELEILSLSGCKLTKLSCKDISSAICSERSSLKQLDLSYNDLQDDGMKELTVGLKNKHCKLQILRLTRCMLTGESCRYVGKSVKENTTLTELDLSCNDLQDTGMKLICNGLKSSRSNLKILRLSGCTFKEHSCKYMASVLQNANSTLKDLDLGDNDLHDSGAEHLSVGLKSSHCTLEKLRLLGCCLTERGWSSLHIALSSNIRCLRELDLSYNYLSMNLLSQTCILKTDNGGEQRMKPGFQKYISELTLDLNTANSHLSLCKRSKEVTLKEEDQQHQHDKQRFQHMKQVLCRERLYGRCYFEVKGSPGAVIAVSYKGISRKGTRRNCLFGRSKKSWSLELSDCTYLVWHDNKSTSISANTPFSERVGVFLDWSAGTLSFYSVSDARIVTHVHTIRTTFCEPLLVGFGLKNLDSSVSL